MTAIIKSWPGFFDRKRVLEVFTHPWADFYFTLGRGKPSKPIDELYYTHNGRILGHFKIREIVRNEGQLPKLTSITGETSEWQIKLGNYVAICEPPFVPLEEKLMYEGFRGWRYFAIDEYRGSLDSQVRL